MFMYSRTLKNRARTIKLKMGLQYICRVLWFLFCGLLFLTAVHEIWSVNIHPEEYVYLWGAEGPIAGIGFYASEAAYLIHEAILLLWFLCGMMLCIPRLNRFNLLIVHFVLSLLWMSVNIA